MLIHEVVSRGSRLHPQRTALKTGGDRITYQQLDSLSNQLADLICRRWPEAIGGLFLGNSIEYAVSFFAIAKAGGVVAPTAISLPPQRLRGDLQFSDARFIITQPKYLEQVREAALHAPQVEGLIVVERGGRSVRVEELRKEPNASIAPSLSSRTAQACCDDPVAMFATSGTAAEPKRVVLSHRNLLANVASFHSIASLAPVNKSLILLPMTAIGTATTEMLAYLAAGMTTHIYTDVFVLGEFCRVLHDERIQVVNVTPFILSVMLERKAEVSLRTCSLKKIFFASAPIPISQFADLAEAFPHVEFFYGYGQTEASPRCTTLLPHDRPRKIGSCGRPLPQVEVAIVDDQSHRLEDGELGEVVVRGPNVMLGYYKRPDLTDQVVRDGWLHTGDCGYLDSDGFLFIRGRKKNIVVTRGISVNPEEVEHEIAAHPAVRESIVGAQSDDRVGERLVARVVLQGGEQLDERQLKSFLRDRLDTAKIPTEIAFVSQLNRNHHNKLIRS